MTSSDEFSSPARRPMVWSPPARGPMDSPPIWYSYPAPPPGSYSPPAQRPVWPHGVEELFAPPNCGFNRWNRRLLKIAKKIQADEEDEKEDIQVHPKVPAKISSDDDMEEDQTQGYDSDYDWSVSKK